MKVQHTKWRWLKADAGQDHIRRCNIVDDQGFVVADNVSFSDASLITAAPDLLDACRQVLFALRSGADISEVVECYCDDKNNGHVCIGHRVEQAISKARGEI